MTKFLACAATVALACLSAAPLPAQAPGQSLVQIYRVAPGHHVDFLKWLAQQEKDAAAAGIAPGQLYVHMDGDSWDYVVINPVNSPAQDAAVDAAARARGANPLRGGIELRKHITSHSDTFARGPTSAAAYLDSIGEK